MRIRKIASILLLTMATTIFAGCGAQEDSEKKVVTMWGAWSGDQVAQLEEQIENFNSTQEKFEVKYVVQNGLEEKILTGIAGGELPDIVLWDRYQTSIYAPKGALEPITDLVEKDGVDLDKFYAPAVDEMKNGNELYGLPLLVDNRVIFYNKTMFNEAGVDANSIKTWDDLANVAVKLTKREDGKLTQSGFSLKDQGLFNIWLKQAGGELVNDGEVATTAFNSEEGLSVLNQWDKMINKDKVFELGFEDGFPGGDGFKAGKVAMTYNGPWALEDYEKAGIDFGVIEPVTGPNGDKGAFMGGFGLAIPKGAKNKDEAWEFMKWWTTNPENGVEFAKISGWLPANVEAANDEYFTNDPNYSVFVNTMSYASIRPKNVGYSDVEGLALTPQLQKFVSGEVTASEALKKAEEQGNKIFQDNSK